MDRVEGISKFERLFRISSGLDVDKSDLKRLYNFINEKIRDMLLIAQYTAKANDRDIIYPWDLPLTKGIEERIHRFKKFNEELGLDPILEGLTNAPMLDVQYGISFEEDLSNVAGAIIVSLADVFKVIDPDLKNPQTEHWDKAFGLYSILM